MKFLILLPLLALALFSNSCRTAMPLDLTTMKPCSKCMPENYSATGCCNNSRSYK